MKRRRDQPADAPMVFPRANPQALARFDPATKICTMNCGPSMSDQRTRAERVFLCDECIATKEIEMGFSLKMFFEELFALIASEKPDAVRLQELSDAIVAAKQYAEERGHLR